MTYRTGFMRVPEHEAVFEGWDFESADATRGMTSPILKLGFPAVSIVVSWIADTPPGTWIEILLRVRGKSAWSRWFSMGVWASGEAMIHRHSVEGQEDEFGSVATDTLDLKAVAETAQLRVSLFSEDGLAYPVVRVLGLSYATARCAVPVFPPGDSSLWNRVVPGVPAYSQMVYPDGGSVWCSPTCITMMEDYWRKPSGSCEARIRKNVAAVYDQVYRGCGNWVFNTAGVASAGLDAFAVRFSSLAQLEPWIAAGIPVALSISWNNGQNRILTGAPLQKSSGHLTLLVGFDATGNLLMHEPASADNEGVARRYLRAELEALWISASGGMAYLLYPHGHDVPAFPASGNEVSCF